MFDGRTSVGANVSHGNSFSGNVVILRVQNAPPSILIKLIDIGLEIPYYYDICPYVSNLTPHNCKQVLSVTPLSKRFFF
jgi:hypothetical protein